MFGKKRVVGLPRQLINCVLLYILVGITAIMWSKRIDTGICLLFMGKDC